MTAKIQLGGKTKLFATNYSGKGSYYFLFQFFDLRNRISREDKLIILFADIAVNIRKHTNFASSDRIISFIEAIRIQREIKALCKVLGIRCKELVVEPISKLWKELLSKQPELMSEVLDFSNYLATADLSIPKEIRDYYYVSTETQYGQAYIIEKFIEFLIAKNITSLIDDAEKADAIILGASTEPAIRRLKTFFKGLKIEFLKKMPCIGHTRHYIPRFVMPNWEMSAKEIFDVLEKYNITKKHSMELISIIERFANEIKIEIDSSDLPKNERVKLAYMLHELLQEIKKKTNKEFCTSTIQLQNMEEIAKISNILRSRNNTNILKLCNGENSITEIAKRLDKSLPNVSSTIKKLHSIGLIDFNEKKKPVKVVDRIEVLL
ncbi:MAG: hypothetical protein J7L14_03390 [Candidatus Diapherotrites archaeon]|nr:hypothetical protein [Candidatus Diapherotrites archaeon]